ncbi:PadR family transcriptional regulator [Aquibacillus rhizosphaerae]|uniref:Helix-turn-helix transcriptional regulator n=1 Tax=Aquibacillus rhizosphaerae TaxID=3051431 RepID=A0ABT7L4R7_9BACI|nr:helix-turn-helix transcriptional regulator [Aquibacillus sp. LR5S19]MDL4840863.1 helix-turn-helix transcriptional regulator [Aquibacillus sp. LR5S19]
MDKEMMKGSIDLLILSLISQKDLYGYEITKVLKNMSEEAYQMSEGTLYSALKRMERKLWIESYWSEEDKGRRKYYRITDSGIKELEQKKKNWKSINALINKSSEGLI